MREPYSGEGFASNDFEFVENRSRWGYKFRFGLFTISDHDMRLIA